MTVGTHPDTPRATDTIEQLSVNTIRTLSMDAVQAANSGHPGTPMALAPVAYTLWRDYLRFDPELPVLAFRESDRKWRALIFNHSTHTIGTRQSGRRSPSFYGLAAQELEAELGGQVCFLEGASGSTHNLTLSGDETTPTGVPPPLRTYCTA